MDKTVFEMAAEAVERGVALRSEVDRTVDHLVVQLRLALGLSPSDDSVGIKEKPRPDPSVEARHRFQEFAWWSGALYAQVADGVTMLVKFRIKREDDGPFKVTFRPVMQPGTPAQRQMLVPEAVPVLVGLMKDRLANAAVFAGEIDAF